jgi:hypothetical protein
MSALDAVAVVTGFLLFRRLGQNLLKPSDLPRLEALSAETKDEVLSLPRTCRWDDTDQTWVCLCGKAEVRIAKGVEGRRDLLSKSKCFTNYMMDYREKWIARGF